jgi:hypothetical protein
MKPSSHAIVTLSRAAMVFAAILLVAVPLGGCELLSVRATVGTGGVDNAEVGIRF